jgi:hypothetical protein
MTVASAKARGLLQPDEVDLICQQEHRKGKGLVAGFIASRSVSVLVGDSGLGKSPLAYQLGLCVAAGLPFLGMETKAGPVIYADYENGLEESQALRSRIVAFLGLTKAPDDFLLWSPENADSLELEKTCADVKPSLLIIDSLRAYDPDFENTRHAGERMKSLRVAAYKHSAAILAIHHIKKPSADGVPPLDDDSTRLMEWLNQASGHRSLINQSDTRIAVDAPRRLADVALVLRWQRRLTAAAGPLYLERVCDQDGEPIGYTKAVGTALLGNSEQAAAFRRLPDEFTFKQAKQIYNRSDDPTSKFLKKCESAGLIGHVSKGKYRRLPDEEAPQS